MTSATNNADQGNLACELQLVNLSDQDEYNRLQLQRKECGWDFEDECLDRWRVAAAAGTKCLFWIIVASSTAYRSTAFAGHISLDSISGGHYYELASADKSLLTISTFFVLPEFRAKGIGREAMKQIERLAKLEPYGSPKCSAITLMSLSCQYVEDPVLRSLYMQWTGEEPLSYERWYSKMGYVKWKEEACTKVTRQDGEVLMLVEVFMKKILE